MTTSLSDLRTFVFRDLRDSGEATWDPTEIDDLVNQGIDAVGAFYPREIVSSFATITSSTFSYSASSFTSIYRLDIYQSTGSYRETVTRSDGTSPDAGWEFHGGVVYLPTLLTLTTGDTITGFGYGGYTQLATSASTTDLDTSGIWAVRVFCQAEAFSRLINDRAQFQQWQDNSNNTDVTAIGLAQLASTARSRWADQQRRLRRIRK